MHMKSSFLPFSWQGHRGIFSSWLFSIYWEEQVQQVWCERRQLLVWVEEKQQAWEYGGSSYYLHGIWMVEGWRKVESGWIHISAEDVVVLLYCPKNLLILLHHNNLIILLLHRGFLHHRSTSCLVLNSCSFKSTLICLITIWTDFFFSFARKNSPRNTLPHRSDTCHRPCS